MIKILRKHTGVYGIAARSDIMAEMNLCIKIALVY